MTTKSRQPQARSQGDAYTDLVHRLEQDLDRAAHTGELPTQASSPDAYTDLVHRLEQNLDRSAQGHVAAPGALRYGPQEINGRSFLASDPPGGARIVEVFGDLATADHVAVLVPGNGHHLGNYFTEDGPDSPRARGELLLRTMQALDPGARVAVVVWVGYYAPADLTAAMSNIPAYDGAPELARLTKYLPRSAHLTLIGHSYGSTVAGLSLATARVDDCVALGSPGMGVWHREELGNGARLWAAQAETDWIRYFPHARLGAFGLGRSPLHPELGATRFGTGDVTGHSGYFLERSESLLNVARIALGRHSDVTSAQADSAQADLITQHAPRFAEVA